MPSTGPPPMLGLVQQYDRGYAHATLRRRQQHLGRIERLLELRSERGDDGARAGAIGGVVLQVRAGRVLRNSAPTVGSNATKLQTTLSVARWLQRAAGIAVSCYTPVNPRSPPHVPPARLLPVWQLLQGRLLPPRHRAAVRDGARRLSERRDVRCGLARDHQRDGRGAGARGRPAPPDAIGRHPHLSRRPAWPLRRLGRVREGGDPALAAVRQPQVHQLLRELSWASTKPSNPFYKLLARGEFSHKCLRKGDEKGGASAASPATASIRRPA